jgi:hypothetical protein
MRTFMAGNGSDSTAATLTYLAAAFQLNLTDLYLIGEIEDPMAVWLTNWPSALSWPVYGTFKPTSIQRGKVTSKVGLEVAHMDVTWSPPLTAFGVTTATMNPYQLAQTGFYDNWKVRIWRCVMPTPGDANTYGATPWFGGRIANSEVSRGTIKLTVNSFLDAINQPVPPNVIELSNGMAGYVGATPVLVDAETSLPTFTVVAPSSINVIMGDCVQPTAHKIYADNKLQNGFIYFLPGSTLAGYWSPIAFSSVYHSGGGILPPNYNEFTLYAPFPFAPTPGDTFYASTQWPVDLASSTAGQYKGFPYVPSPLAAI